MKKTIVLTRTAVIAALYAVVTLLVYPIAYGPIQCRVSEALTILPLFYAEAVPGLTIGCFIANCFSGGWDMLFGTAATLIAALYFALRPLVKRYSFMKQTRFADLIGKRRAEKAIQAQNAEQQK